MLRIIVWNLNALQQFEAAIVFIEQDSPANAFKVKTNILRKIEQLLSHPEMYPPDKFKIKNDGSFRAFEMYRYRIAYKISQKQIRIIRVRHSSMKPKNY